MTRKLGEMGTFIKGAPLSKADISDEGTPFILYGELYTTYSEVTNSVKRKTDKTVEHQFYSKIGDVIMPTSGETPEDIATASCIMIPDVILESIDRRIATQQKLIETLKKYKRGVMRAIFRDKAILFSETTKWKSVRLGDECTFFSGGTPKSTDSSFYGGASPFIRSGEIHSDKTELFLTDDGLKYSSAKMVSKGDLIIALYGATSGEVDISKIDGAINQAILCIRPSWINKVYLKYLLEDRKDDILNTYLQGGQGILSAEIIKNLIFDIPDEGSQLVVVDFLNTMDRRINSSIMLMENLITLRSGLMQQLFI